MWCDFCVLQPLFRLYTFETCIENTTGIHNKGQQRRNDGCQATTNYYNTCNSNSGDDDVESISSSSSSDDSSTNICTKTELYDPYHM